MRPAILLLGSNERAALAVCRSLGRMGARIEILRFSWDKTPADFSKYSARSHYIGEPYANVRRYSEALLRLVERRRYDYLFPINDVANELAYFNYDSLGALATLIGPTPEDYRKASNKHAALQIGQQAGIRSPESVYLAGDDSSVPALGFPLYAKPVQSALIRDNYLHTFSVRKVTSPAQLESKLRDDLPRVPVLLQQEISGHGVGLNFCAFKGTLCGVSVTIRVHEPVDGGGSSYRQTGELTPELFEVAKAIARHLEWTGMMMVELKSDGRDLYMMELNCRPWGSIELSIQSGVDYPRLVLDSMVRHAPTDAVVLPVRQMFVRNLKSDVGWIWRRRRTWLTKESDLPGWLWSFHRVVLGREKFDLEQPADALPAFSQLSASLSQLGKRGARLLRRVAPRSNGTPARPHVSPSWKLLFVCRGNINRSVVAQHYLSAQGFRSVCSAGIIGQQGRKPSAQAEAYLRSRGIDASEHRSRDVRTLERELMEADLVIVFDRRNMAELAELYPALTGRVRLLSSIASGGNESIGDPHDRTDAEYARCFDRIVKHLDRVIADGRS